MLVTVIGLGSLLILGLCHSVWYGDATTYVRDIRDGHLIEPGHLLWRPLGYLVAGTVGALGSSSDVLWVLQWLSLISSALAVAAMSLFLLTAGCNRLITGAIAALLLVSNGFWTYSFSGCSYSLSLFFLIIALVFAVAKRDAPVSLGSAVMAGGFAGAAAAAWAIQCLAIPAVFLVMVLTPGWDRAARRIQLRNSIAMMTGGVLTFVAPLLGAWSLQASHAFESGGHRSAGLNLWLASSNHGIPAHLGVSQLGRVLIGWPQSMLSMLDLGQQLRLWGLHERGFPWSPWMLTPVIVYAGVISVGCVLLKRFRTHSSFERGLVIASLVAICTNLLFALTWQGTDLERYFPSLPFQLLLVALAARTRMPARSGLAIALTAIALCGVASVNWGGAFAAAFSSDSYRQVWLRELRKATGGKDLVILLGQRKSDISDPHDPDLPKIDNVSNEIVMRGAGWEAAELNNIHETMLHGGRVFLGDSLFGTDGSARDGWSFKEYPSPSPLEIRRVFLPFKSDTIAFTAAGERVWLGAPR
ncbi:MAG TPA: hypothetical protein VIE42_00295 [Steroidobacteraceae bacterium]|jgi:hypothetical protein